MNQSTSQRPERRALFELWLANIGLCLVQAQVYRAHAPDGIGLKGLVFLNVALLASFVSVRPARRTTDFRFCYTFTADDATAGTVTFRAVANLITARDAQPADNEATAVTRRVSR